MEFHGERLRQSTRPAKLIQDALKPFRENFTGGTRYGKNWLSISLLRQEKQRK